MSLVNLNAVLAQARRNRYAVGGFNFNGLEDAYGIASAAKTKKAPVILMASCGAVKYIGLHTIAAMVKGISDDLQVDCVLHLDHATDEEFIFECIRAGFTSVMIDASAKPFKENITVTKKVADYARKYGVSVEAELGTIGGREEEINSDTIVYTNPEDVPEFIQETGIDALAVAVGTAHGFYKEKPKLKFDIIEKIASITDIPLVLHGGTGVPEEDFVKAAKSGIAKINVGTELKYAFSDTIRRQIASLPQSEIDPRKVLRPVKETCQKIVENKISIFGSEGKA